MRRLLLILGGFVSGITTLVSAVTLLAIATNIYLRQAFHLGPNEAVGFDVVSLCMSLFGRHWQILLPTLLLSVFAIGFTGGYWFLRKRILYS
jgi:hypothetical protein